MWLIRKIWNGVLCMFFLFIFAASVTEALHGGLTFLNSLLAIVSFFIASLLVCNLYPRHMLADNARQSIKRTFATTFILWMSSTLLYIVYHIIIIDKPLGAVAFLVFIVCSGWLWKRWWKWRWKSHHDAMGLANVEHMPQWGVEEWNREFRYARQRYDTTTDANQKVERSLDVLALIGVARQYGFVQERQGESFETLHFVKLDKKE